MVVVVGHDVAQKGHVSLSRSSTGRVPRPAKPDGVRGAGAASGRARSAPTCRASRRERRRLRGGRVGLHGVRLAWGHERRAAPGQPAAAQTAEDAVPLAADGGQEARHLPAGDARRVPEPGRSRARRSTTCRRSRPHGWRPAQERAASAIGGLAAAGDHELGARSRRRHRRADDRPRSRRSWTTRPPGCSRSGGASTPDAFGAPIRSEHRDPNTHRHQPRAAQRLLLVLLALLLLVAFAVALALVQASTARPDAVPTPSATLIDTTPETPHQSSDAAAAALAILDAIPVAAIERRVTNATPSAPAGSTPTTTAATPGTTSSPAICATRASSRAACASSSAACSMTPTRRP